MSNITINPVWHRVLYSCTCISRVGIKGLIYAADNDRLSQLPNSVSKYSLFWWQFSRICLLLVVSHVRATFASRGFSVAVWNPLPSDIHHSFSTHTFHHLLKTPSSQQAFSSTLWLTQVPQVQPLTVIEDFFTY